MTKKFDIGDWVFDEKTDRFGRVTKIIESSRSVKVRWMNEQRADVDAYSTARLEHRTPMPFVLEGVLESDIYDDSRSEQPLLRRWLGSFNYQFSIKTVYQLSDIELLTQEIGNRHPPFIHINCHGDVDETSRRPFIILFEDRLYLDDPETIRAFRHLEGYPLFFSACNLGKFQKPMVDFKEAAKLGSIVAASREISDSEAMLFGLMLYQSILGGGMEFDQAYFNSIQASQLLNMVGRQGHGQAYARLF